VSSARALWHTYDIVLPGTRAYVTCAKADGDDVSNALLEKIYEVNASLPVYTYASIFT
jgi:hypothetical protein